MHQVYEEPTILLAKRVTGEEEVPVGVVGLISGDAPDVLSHLSVRARNMKVLFAACHDHALLGEIDRLAGGWGREEVGGLGVDGCSNVLAAAKDVAFEAVPVAQ